MSDNFEVEHAERLSVIETNQASSLKTQEKMQETLEKMDARLQSIENMVQQGKGATRLVAWGGIFFGASTAAALYAKWSLFLTWMGK